MNQPKGQPGKPTVLFYAYGQKGAAIHDNLDTIITAGYLPQDRAYQNDFNRLVAKI